MMDGKLYKSMEFIMNAFLLNLLWLVLCLPILTIFPATTAMFGVVREWKKQNDIRIFTAFFRLFKENFKQSFFIGILWLVFTGLLLGDLIIINQLNSSVKYVLFSFFFLMGILYLFVSIYIFPVLVHYQVTWKNAIKNALLLSISRLHYTILSILIIAACLVLCFYLPAAMMLGFSISAYLIYSLVSGGFHHENEEKIS
ncbi:YesL family protein [Neobacillus niacini]|uniref:YesL family protein n=1 Tax=Neobacillus niacini TaxID=86668 RepID=UPI003B01A4EC